VADLEQRVSTLERERFALKARVDTADEELKSMPDLIKAEFRLTNSQIARLSRDVAGLHREVGELRDLPAKVDALPRVIAEILAERDKKR